MERLAWSDSFSVGHTALDEEHRSIIAIINSIGADESNEDGLRQRLECLLVTTSKHFEHEKLLMQAILSALDVESLVIESMSRQVADEHLREHELSLDLLGRMATEASVDQPRNPSELYEYLVHWFVQHAVKHDAELKAVFQALERDCPALLRTLV